MIDIIYTALQFALILGAGIQIGRHIEIKRAAKLRKARATLNPFL